MSRRSKFAVFFSTVVGVLAAYAGAALVLVRTHQINGWEEGFAIFLGVLGVVLNMVVLDTMPTA